MTFEEILDQAMAMLQRRGRLTHGTLKRQFQLDDAALEDLKNEIIYGQRLAVAEEERVLLWTGAPPSAPPPTSALPPAGAPLAEKILLSRSALEGERKQVTVLFADLKGSMELLAERDSEEARQLLDPVLERMIEAVQRYEGTVNQMMAEELGMRPLVARCHLGLGTLYAKTGQWQQARAELSTAIEMYRAMAMTFWLPQAEAALAQVEGR